MAIRVNLKTGKWKMLQYISISLVQFVRKIKFVLDDPVVLSELAGRQASSFAGSPLRLMFYSPSIHVLSRFYVRFFCFFRYRTGLIRSFTPAQSVQAELPFPPPAETLYRVSAGEIKKFHKMLEKNTNTINSDLSIFIEQKESLWLNVKFAEKRSNSGTMSATRTKRHRRSGIPT